MRLKAERPEISHLDIIVVVVNTAGPPPPLFHPKILQVPNWYGSAASAPKAHNFFKGPFQVQLLMSVTVFLLLRIRDLFPFATSVCEERNCRIWYEACAPKLLTIFRRIVAKMVQRQRQLFFRPGCHCSGPPPPPTRWNPHLRVGGPPPPN